MRNRLLSTATMLLAFAAAPAMAQEFPADEFPADPATDCMDWVDTCPGIWLSGELLTLIWSDTDGDDGNDSLSPAYRTTFGFDFGGGRNAQIRYTGLKIEDTDPTPTGTYFEAQEIDLAYAGRFTLGPNWQGEIAVGGRWTSMSNPTPRDWPSLWGPMVGVTVRSPLTEQLAVYARARAAYLFGTETVEDHAHQVPMAELGAGIEWTGAVEKSQVFLRAGVEARLYQSVRDDEEDYGLLGLTVGGGVKF